MRITRTSVVAPLTAATLIAQQVGGNAMRDGLFLSTFGVESLPYFIAGAAVLGMIAAQLSGRLLARFGPVRVVPALCALNAALFLVEWALISWQPHAAAALLYTQSSVLGAIAISAYWSLLNERFDPHSAKPLIAKVAAAAALGGFLGGVGAERAGALLPPGSLFPLLGIVGAVCTAGALAVGRDTPRERARVTEEAEPKGAWAHFRQERLLRGLALVVALASMVAALADYVLKAEAVAYFGKGPQLVRFFGLFYSFTGLGAVLIQTVLGRVAIARLGLGGSVASHPVLVGASGLLGFLLPSPWRGIFPRAFDVTVRASTFRAGYELFYTPFAEATKRSAKGLIDVTIDNAGKTLGAVLILGLVALAPSHPLVAVNLAVVLVAAAELLVVRSLRAGYVSVLEGGLRRQGGQMEQSVESSMADFTVARSMTGLDRAALLQAVGSVGVAPPAELPADPVIAALVELRSGDFVRIRAALREPPRDPLIVGALVPLLERDDVTRSVVPVLAAFGARAAGEMVSVLLDPATPDVVRRRLPTALKSCPTPIARDGLQTALEGFSFETRRRCGRALLALTDEHPELMQAFPRALELAEQELGGGSEPHLVREHVFNLLALALDREPIRIAARAFAGDDEYVRGTALEYLETVLPARVFFAFQPLLSAAGPAPARRRPAEDVRADLMKAGETMTVSLDELRRRLEAVPEDI